MTNYTCIPDIKNDDIILCLDNIIIIIMYSIWYRAQVALLFSIACSAISLSDCDYFVERFLGRDDECSDSELRELAISLSSSVIRVSDNTTHSLKSEMSGEFFTRTCPKRTDSDHTDILIKAGTSTVILTPHGEEVLMMRNISGEVRLGTNLLYKLRYIRIGGDNMIKDGDEYATIIIPVEGKNAYIRLFNVSGL